MKIVLSDREYIGGSGSSSLFFRNDDIEIFRGRFGNDRLFDIRLFKYQIEFIVLDDHEFYTNLEDFKKLAYPYDQVVQTSDLFKNRVNEITEFLKDYMKAESIINTDIIHQQFLLIEQSEKQGFKEGVNEQQNSFKKILFGENSGCYCGDIL